MALENGTQLGPYEILSPAGAGGMGEVYKARDTRLDRVVAIKVLPTHMVDAPDVRQRFDREARAISSLNHPHICTLHDVGHQDGIDYLVMEFLEGETLSSRLTRGALPTPEFLAIGAQIADALDKAHRQGLVHRDLKPGNIMLTRSGAKLLDFGLAKLQQVGGVVQGADGVTRTTPLTGAGSIVGTLQYMSPEQLEGKEADHRSDVFALGTVLYEMATGQRAFAGTSQASLIASILKEEPRSVLEIQPKSPSAIERAIRQCLSKDPEERWQSAGDLKRELLWIREQAPSSGVSGTSVVAGKAQSRKGWLAAAALVVVAGLATFVMFRSGGELTLPALSKRFDLSVENLDAGFRISPVISPDGRYVVYHADHRLWLRDLTRFDAVAIADSRDLKGVFWSPDSRAIAFSQDKRAWKYEIESEAKTPLCAIPESGNITSGAWNRSGDMVLAVYRGGLYRVSDRGGAPDLLLGIDSLKNHDFHTPTFLPDGQTLVLFVHAYKQEDDCLAVLERGARELKRLMPAPAVGGVTYSPTGHLLYTYEEVNESIWAVPFSVERLEVMGRPFLAVLGGQFPSLSEEGAMVYSTGTASKELQMMRMSLDGGSIEAVGTPMAGWSSPVFTPDGERITFTATDGSRRNLWQYDLRRGTRTRLTSDSSEDVLAIWVPSRKQYMINRIQGVGKGLLLMFDPTTGRVTDTLAQGLDPTLSPDGRYLTYNTDVRGKISIWRLNLDGPPHPEVLLDTDPGLWGDATPVAPNGLWFSYVSDETGIPQVYVRRFLESSEAIQVSVHGGVLPFWHPSGNSLFFVTDSSLMQVDMEWSQPPRLSQPKVLVNALSEQIVLEDINNRSTVAISPDGSYFVVGKLAGESQVQRLLYVERWQAEASPAP